MIDRILYFCVSPKLNNETRARNAVEGFLLGSFFNSKAQGLKYQRPKTYPQGKIKSLDKLLYLV